LVRGTALAKAPDGRDQLRDNDTSCQVAIIGAGPYGLSTAAHLHARKVETRIFGEPMEFWKRQMPRGMFLRSAPSASSLDDAGDRFRLSDYRSSHNLPNTKPLPLDEFLPHGEWFQEQAVPHVDRRRIVEVAQESRGFRVRLDDGEEFQARQVVVATGISPFAYRPAQFEGLPDALVSHSLGHSDLSRFARQKVVVVGSGQSALESAAILCDAGAEVEVVARTTKLNWLAAVPDNGSFSSAVRGVLSAIARPPLDIMGPRFTVWLVAWPRLFRKSPQALQDFLTARAVRPAGSGWLRPRLVKAQMTLGCTVTTAAPAGSQLHLRLSDGTDRRVDHLLLGTGYRVDVSRYPFLTPTLRQAVETYDGYPKLGVGFESSVPGLHFLGTAAAKSFGPVCRFVAGTRYVSRAVSRFIAQRSSKSTNGHAPSAVSTRRGDALALRAE